MLALVHERAPKSSSRSCFGTPQCARLALRMSREQNLARRGPACRSTQNTWLARLPVAQKVTSYGLSILPQQKGQNTTDDWCSGMPHLQKCPWQTACHPHYSHQGAQDQTYRSGQLACVCLCEPSFLKTLYAVVQNR